MGEGKKKTRMTGEKIKKRKTGNVENEENRIGKEGTGKKIWTQLWKDEILREWK